jgi:hypothetical protein
LLCRNLRKETKRKKDLFFDHGLRDFTHLSVGSVTRQKKRWEECEIRKTNQSGWSRSTENTIRMRITGRATVRITKLG